MKSDSEKQKAANAFLDSWWENLSKQQQFRAAVLMEMMRGIPDGHPLGNILMRVVLEEFPDFPHQELFNVVKPEKKDE